MQQSRKYRLTLFCLGLVVIGFIATAVVASLSVVYAEYLAGILGLLTIYCGGNVGSKYVTTHKKEEEKKDE